MTEALDIKILKGVYCMLVGKEVILIVRVRARVGCMLAPLAGYLCNTIVAGYLTAYTNITIPSSKMTVTKRNYSIINLTFLLDSFFDDSTSGPPVRLPRCSALGLLEHGLVGLVLEPASWRTPDLE